MLSGTISSSSSHCATKDLVITKVKFGYFNVDMQKTFNLSDGSSERASEFAVYSDNPSRSELKHSNKNLTVPGTSCLCIAYEFAVYSDNSSRSEVKHSNKNLTVPGASCLCIAYVF